MAEHSSVFGQFFKEMRAKSGLSLRAFCQKNGLDPGNISKIERGLTAPPISHDKLVEYAKFLKLSENSDEWLLFFDLAAAESGRIPASIMNNEEIVSKLPLVFRTLRGQKVPKENLQNLIELIRRS
jgi:transcriptional regulator with XRE-family HTH domain